MDLISAFNSVRDIPYRIPLKWRQKDDCCSGKHKKLFNLFTRMGYPVRYRVCVFLWSNLNLPSELKKIPHDDDCTHVYLEINIKGKWKILDATWDKGLKNIFHVNEWDGKSDTEIAVKPIKIFTPQKSLKIASNQNKETIDNDLKINGDFYKSFNEWLEKMRKKSS